MFSNQMLTFIHLKPKKMIVPVRQWAHSPDHICKRLTNPLVCHSIRLDRLELELDLDTNRSNIVVACPTIHRCHTFDSHCQSMCNFHDTCTLLALQTTFDVPAKWLHHAQATPIHRNQYLYKMFKSFACLNRFTFSFQMKCEMFKMFTFACRCFSTPNAQFAFACCIADESMSDRTWIRYIRIVWIIATRNGCILKWIGRTTWQRS